jgi:NADPH:quinone reductase-like Zn-dependent oxidoreductase
MEIYKIKIGNKSMERYVYEVESKGKISGLKLKKEILNPLKDTEIQIKVHAIGLNFADLFAIFGIYSATPNGKFIPGLEISGEITAVGSSVNNWKVGDRVMAATRLGGYATYIHTEVDSVFPLPEHWSYEEGAAFIVQALTAYYALKVLGDCKKDDVVLIHSAAGGVGILANRIAKRLGAITIGCVGSESKFTTLDKEGFDYKIVRTKSFKHDLSKILINDKLDLVLECIGGRIFKDSFELLSPMGRLVTYGSANFTPSTSRFNPIPALIHYITRPKIDPLKMISDNKSVMGFNLIWLWNHINKLRDYFNDLWKLSSEPQRIGKVYEWNNIHVALNDFRKGKTIGKVVIKL